MKIPVEVMVSNKRFDYREVSSVGEIPTPKESSEYFVGDLKLNSEGFNLIYTEDNDGFDVVETSVIYKNGMVVLRHGGDINSSLVFVKGKSCDCFYPSGGKQYSVCVTTHNISSDIGILGGRIIIDYTVDIMGNRAEKNTLCLSLCPLNRVS